MSNLPVSLIALCLLPLSVFSAEVAQLTDYARDANGKIISMTVAEADKFCDAKRMFLPTAREVAEYLASKGAKGILESRHQESDLVELNEMKKKGFMPVYSGYEPDGDDFYIEFYFNVEGFRYDRPMEYDENPKFWTRSTVRTRDITNYRFDSPLYYDPHRRVADLNFMWVNPYTPNRNKVTLPVRCLDDWYD